MLFIVVIWFVYPMRQNVPITEFKLPFKLRTYSSTLSIILTSLLPQMVIKNGSTQPLLITTIPLKWQLNLKVIPFTFEKDKFLLFS